jgi:hypothetical protein
MGCILVVPFCSMCTSVVEPVHVTRRLFVSYCRTLIEPIVHAIKSSQSLNFHGHCKI